LAEATIVVVVVVVVVVVAVVVVVVVVVAVMEAAMVLVVLAAGEPAPVNLRNKLWLGNSSHVFSPHWLEAAGIGMVIDCGGYKADTNMKAWWMGIHSLHQQPW